MKILKTYKNGNYNVIICDDGTKARYNDEDFFEADFPESIDLKITNRCPYNCSFCHENSKSDGKYAELVENIDGKLSFVHKFMDTLVSGTELAIGGGAVTTHPQLRDFLILLKERGIIANFTVNQTELFDNLDTIQEYIDLGLVNGVGISFRKKDERLIDFCHKNKNSVIHVINGVILGEDIEWLSNKNLKMLVLGYKDFRRGADFHDETVDHNKEEFRKIIGKIIKNGYFDAISFDNLAIKQFDIKNVIGDDDFNKMYMGDDGQFTMYIDLPNEKFATSSILPENQRRPITDDIRDMFAVVKSGM